MIGQEAVLVINARLIHDETFGSIVDSIKF